MKRTYTPVSKSKRERLQRSLFLASSSPRRSEILKQAHVKFKVIPNLMDVEPPYSNYQRLSPQIRKLITQKALKSKGNYKGLILTADTVVFLDGQVLGKPKSLAEAKRMLTALSGKRHSVFTGVCLLDTISHKKVSRIIETQVEFKVLSPAQISTYCDTMRPLDKAGGYGIQEVPDAFISYIDGCIYNVMGLPIKTLLQMLKGYDIV